MSGTDYTDVKERILGLNNLIKDKVAIGYTRVMASIPVSDRNEAEYVFNYYTDAGYEVELHDFTTEYLIRLDSPIPESVINKFKSGD